VATFFKGLAWFVVGAAAWGGLIRLVLSRRLATIQERRRLVGVRLARLMGPVCLVGTLGYGLIFVFLHLAVWPLMLIAFLLLIAADFAVQARGSSLDSRVWQNRLFGILYLGYAAGACVLTLHLRF
jgi:hypothetical protein